MTQSGQRTLGGRYERRRLLGRGGMAQVYEAYDRTLGRNVALKQLHLSVAADPQARERFVREARTAAGLSSSGIARIYDVGDDPEGPYLVQELVEGRELATILPLPAEQALDAAAQLAETLDLIHRQGVVHCDIKPQNVILTPDQRAVLLDFGIAEPPGAQVEKVFGTPQYLAPERAQGAPPAPASDVYALGVLLYELLTGDLPVDGATPQEVLRRHVDEGVPPLRKAAPGMATALEALLAQATARDPGQRPTMGVFAAELRAILQQAAQNTAVLPAVPQRHTVSIHNMRTNVNPAVPATPPPLATAAGAPPRQAAAQPSATDFRPAGRPPQAGPGPAAGRRRGLALLPLLLVPLLALAALIQGRSSNADLRTPAGASETPGPSATAAIAVPVLLGMAEPEARALLEQLGLKLAVVAQEQDNAPAGSITRQNPEPGGELQPSETVQVVISAGPPPPQNESPGNVGEDGAGGNSDGAEKDKDKDKGKGKGKDKK